MQVIKYKFDTIYPLIPTNRPIKFNNKEVNLPLFLQPFNASILLILIILHW